MRPRHSGTLRGGLGGLESQLHDGGRSVSVPDLGWRVRESRENTGEWRTHRTDHPHPGAPQVPQRTSSIAAALNTSGAGGARPAQAVRAR